jgi:hypothetical protein
VALSTINQPNNQNKTADIYFSTHSTQFWNKLHPVRSTSKEWKPNNLKVSASKYIKLRASTEYPKYVDIFRFVQSKKSKEQFIFMPAGDPYCICIYT